MSYPFGSGFQNAHHADRNGDERKDFLGDDAMVDWNDNDTGAVVGQNSNDVHDTDSLADLTEQPFWRELFPDGEYIDQDAWDRLPTSQPEADMMTGAIGPASLPSQCSASWTSAPSLSFNKAGTPSSGPEPIDNSRSLRPLPTRPVPPLLLSTSAPQLGTPAAAPHPIRPSRPAAFPSALMGSPIPEAFLRRTTVDMPCPEPGCAYICATGKPVNAKQHWTRLHDPDSPYAHYHDLVEGGIPCKVPGCDHRAKTWKSYDQHRTTKHKGIGNEGRQSRVLKKGREEGGGGQGGG